MTWRLVILESPFSGDVARNRAYLKECIRDCIHRGESPYASHQMLTEALRDSDAIERAEGIDAGFAWRSAAEVTVVYQDFGVSPGMQAGIADARSIGQQVEFRRLHGGSESGDLADYPTEG